MTASEAFKRRKPVDSAQTDSVVISIGYPLTDSVYSPQQDIDFRPPLPVMQDQPAGADDFIEFIDQALHPFIRSTVFPNVQFTRDSLYGKFQWPFRPVCPHPQAYLVRHVLNGQPGPLLQQWLASR